uniref:Novel immune-type receptor 12 n=1 Tax=Paramormyrops kingsleyae TaxID=1676925 RepID=A0A3B3RTU9_9TELE
MWSTLEILLRLWPLSDSFQVPGFQDTTTSVYLVNLVLLTQAEHMKTFHLGDTVTLHCSISSVDSTYFYWFKQAVGESPQSIMSVYSYNMELVFYGEFQGDQRFAVHKNSTNMSLTISNAKPMDSGFYFCCTREYERIIFWNNFFLKYEGNKLLIQQPVSNSVHPGDSVTLQCTIETESCAGEHGVYWFKHGSGESLPGVIYTHGNRSDKCKKSSEAGSPTQSCVYSLPKRNLSLSDAGTYYCAVAMCGEILFGNGTKLNIKGDLFYFDNYSINVSSPSLSLYIRKSEMGPRMQKTNTDVLYSDIRLRE